MSKDQRSASPREVGSALVVSYHCICGGSDRWKSQPGVGGKYVGNELTVASNFMRLVSSCYARYHKRLFLYRKPYNFAKKQFNCQ